MSKDKDYLAELQQLDSALGMVKLRTLFLEFDSTLSRLPKLKAEAEAMLKPQTGVNYDELAARLEGQLATAADLLLKYDMIPDDIRIAPEMVEFWNKANASMTLRAVEKLLPEIEKKEKEAKKIIQDSIRQTEKKAEEEAEKIRKDEELKIQKARKKAKEAARRRDAEEEARQNLGFIINKDGTVSDPRTGLMWAAQDNGSDINWKNAKSYCDNYRGGGFSDWRLPRLSELQGLHSSGVRDGQEKPIRIYGWFWSSEIRGSEASNFYFITGIRYWNLQSDKGFYRALPVRSDNYTLGSFVRYFL